jgi:hypothetical protein
MADLLPLSSGPDPAVMEAIERGNSVVFLDVALGEGDDAVPLGRIKLELFVKDVRPVRAGLVHVLVVRDWRHPF